MNSAIPFALILLVALAQEPTEVDFIRNGNFEAARKYLEVLLPRQSASPNLQCNYGIALLQLQDYTQALEHLQKAVDLNPTLFPAWLNLAACYVCLGEYDRAIGAYRRAQSLKPAESISLDSIISFLQDAKKADVNAPNYLDKDWQAWEAGSMIRLHVATPSQNKAYKKQYKQIAIDAMQKWIDATGGALKLQVVPNANNANVIVEWSPARTEGISSLEHRGLTGAMAMNGHITSARVAISLGNESGFDVLRDQTVSKACLHEFGHALGIRGHSYNPQDIMFELIELPTVEPRLTARDIETVRLLYIGKNSFDTTHSP